MMISSIDTAPMPISGVWPQVISEGDEVHYSNPINGELSRRLGTEDNHIVLV